VSSPSECAAHDGKRKGNHPYAQTPQRGIPFFVNICQLLQKLPRGRQNTNTVTTHVYLCFGKSGERPVNERHIVSLQFHTISNISTQAVRNFVQFREITCHNIPTKSIHLFQKVFVELQKNGGRAKLVPPFSLTFISSEPL
jgi:hypothetical protein